MVNVNKISRKFNLIANKQILYTTSILMNQRK